MTIETRPESEAWRGAGGEKPLRLSHSNSSVRTVELDLDSLHNAGFGDVSFVVYPLGIVRWRSVPVQSSHFGSDSDYRSSNRHGPIQMRSLLCSTIWWRDILSDDPSY